MINNELPWQHLSQQYEDDLVGRAGTCASLRAIFDVIGTTNKYFVEFGCVPSTEWGDVSEFFMLHRGWSGLLLDINGSGIVKNEHVRSDNINDLFKKYSVPEEFDLLSIDIDSNDYWIWMAINGYRPRVVCIEYNSSVGPDESKTVEYDPDWQCDGTDYFGASLLALDKLATGKGYSLVGGSRCGDNAFFVRRDLLGPRILSKNVSEVWVPHVGRPKSERRMIDV